MLLPIQAVSPEIGPLGGGDLVCFFQSCRFWAYPVDHSCGVDSECGVDSFESWHFKMMNPT